ncbi:hypothetical protein ACLQ3K_16095 [Tsukamurella sp. DT100]|uniref:hypothetical protein n=1 Tax=Tsukamurella sp. DT100 TaxID=3393415 RepID=UPI003CF448AB
MYAHVSHRGALLPAASRLDPDANRRLLEWIASNCTDLDQRITVMPNRNAPLDGNAVLKRFSSAGTVEIARNHPRSPGGPVLSAWPTLDDLAVAIGATPKDQTVICLEWSESYQGWASAVGAYNAATDEIEPSIDDELIGDFKFVLQWDSEIFGGAKRGHGREIIQPTIKKLKNAGLSELFVASYAVGLGASASIAENLRKHYREV